MSKKVIVDVEGVSYTLEFNRMAIRTLERAGFNPLNAEIAPVDTLYQLFWGATRMHHGTLTAEKSDSVLDALLDDGYELGDILESLSELYSEVFTSEPSSKKEKKTLTVV